MNARKCPITIDISNVILNKIRIFALDKSNDMDWYGMTDAAIVAELGKRIKATRLKKKFTQQEVAERAGISVFTVSQMENGKNTSLNSLTAVMRVLKLLENFDSLIPEQKISPIELLEAKKKKRKK